MHISNMVSRNSLNCPHCRGRMIRENWFDLPRDFFEFFCLNCGKRIWFKGDLLEKPIYSN